MSNNGASNTPLRSTQPSSPLSPEDLLIKRNKYLVNNLDISMTFLTDAGSETAGHLMSSLHRNILATVREDLESVVNDAVKGAIDDNLQTLKSKNAKLSKKNKALKKRVKELETAMNEAEQCSRRKSLRISNVPEDANENTYKLVLDIARAVHT